MGLEAINFFFRSNDPIKKILDNNSEISIIDNKRYVYKKEMEFWIDIELQDDFSLSIRIALCNSNRKVLNALYNLLMYLFKFGGVLYNLNTKEIFKTYDEKAKDKINSSYEARKKVFEYMYNDFEAAISSEEFYRIQREMRGIID